MAVEDTLQLRFRLGANSAAELAGSRLATKRGKGRPARDRREETWFDTPRLALRRAGFELKVYAIGGRRTRILRAPGGESGSEEWRSDLGAGEPGFGRLEALPRGLIKRHWKARLQPVFTRHLERTTIGLRKGGASMELAVEVGRLTAFRRGGPVSEEISEARLSLVSGRPARMMEVALELIESLDATLWHETPEERGYALAKPALRPQPAKAGAVVLDRGMTVGEALLASADGALRHLFANQAPTLAGHPEGIHQSRVAIRRLRAILRAFKAGLPYGGRKAFNYESRWFQKRMGAARDWHVFLDETIPRMLADGVDERLVEKLRRIARDERRRTSREAAEAMASRRFSRLVLHFEHWLLLLPRQDSDGQLARRLLPFARGVLRKTHRDLLEDTRPLSRMSVADLHALRIRAKKARYAGEFFHALYDQERAATQLRLLAGLQDRLGALNDASVARQLLATLKAGRLPSATLKAVREWSGRRIHRCALEAQAQWRELQRIRPFWL